MKSDRNVMGRKPDLLKIDGPWEKALKKALTRDDPPRKTKKRPALKK